MYCNGKTRGGDEQVSELYEASASPGDTCGRCVFMDRCVCAKAANGEKDALSVICDDDDKGC